MLSSSTLFHHLHPFLFQLPMDLYQNLIATPHVNVKMWRIKPHKSSCRGRCPRLGAARLPCRVWYEAAASESRRHENMRCPAVTCTAPHRRAERAARATDTLPPPQCKHTPRSHKGQHTRTASWVAKLRREPARRIWTKTSDTEAQETDNHWLNNNKSLITIS